MDGFPSPGFDSSQFVEMDPTGRYGRYNEILGKGASKTVYKAFDEYEGIEVAWNQVKLYDFLQRPEDLERLYCEIHLLKTLKHDNIMKFYTSWVDIDNRNINFVTEMFTSGTLRQYRLKHRRVNIRAVKHWCRQILKGLLYLHSHDPPIIHRDLKCDNIFVNGNQGEVKIGDLGLAAILKKSHAACCVGTPEFMAPEVYDEQYNELIDIYSFGMCVLEMVTFEYPYSECNHPAQIYKKVISGRKPDALYKVQSPEVKQFVEKCIAAVSRRLSARELLDDPFLRNDEYGFDLRPLEYEEDLNALNPLVRQTLAGSHHCNGSLINGYADYLSCDPDVEPEYPLVEFETSDLELFSCQADEQLANLDIAIQGRRREDDGIFLRLRIADKEGRIRNIYFPFDIETDTALDVATEMVAELDVNDQDAMKIADMIDSEIEILVPDWKRGVDTDENSHCTYADFCDNCAPYGHVLDHVSSNSPNVKNLQVLACSRHGCAAVHGRFEEITYQVEGPQQPNGSNVATVLAGQSNTIDYTDIWAQREVPESSSPRTREIHCDEGCNMMNRSIIQSGDTDSPSDSNERSSISSSPSLSHVPCDDYENEIRQELRWLKVKYQMQLEEFRDQQLGAKFKPSGQNHKLDNMEHKKGHGASLPSFSPEVKRKDGEHSTKSPYACKNSNFYVASNANESCADPASRTVRNCEPYSPERIITAKSFYARALLPHSLNRSTSLPVDVVDV